MMWILTGTQVLLAVVILNSCISGTSAYTNPYKTLLDDLFENYTKFARPVYNQSEPVVVSYGLAVNQIIEVDVKNQQMDCLVWHREEWDDQFLAWDPDDYSNITELRISPAMVWLPDIVLYNSVSSSIDGHEREIGEIIPLTVSNEGRVTWYSPGVLTTTCLMNVKYFPFDSQECDIEFGSWTYTADKVDITNRSETGDTYYYVKNGEWELSEIPVVRIVESYPSGTYTSLTFNIIIKRESFFYELNLILPCSMISSIALLGFLLPCEAGEKITLGITVLLSLTVNLLLISNMMPATSTSMPIIGTYFIITIAMVTCSLVVTVIVLIIQYPHNTEKKLKMPRWVRVFLFYYCARFLCVDTGYVRHVTNVTQVRCETNNGYENGGIHIEEFSTSKNENVLLEVNSSPLRKPESSVSPTRVRWSKMETMVQDILSKVKELVDEIHDKKAETERADDWRSLALVIDRMMFVVFSLVCLGSSLLLILGAKYKFITSADGGI